MKARFSGKCRCCERWHIKQGDSIVKYSGGWASEECAKRTRLVVSELQNLCSRMREHNIGYGVFGIPEGCKPTFTRADFLEEAIKHGEVDDNLVKELKWFWQGIMNRDLSD